MRSNTTTRYRGTAARNIKPYLGDKPIAQLKLKDIQKLYDTLAKQGNRNTGEGLSSGTIRGIHSMLHEALDAAQHASIIPRNPSEEIEAPQFTYKPKRVLTNNQLNQFMEAIREDTIWYDFFYTELTTDLRQGELAALQWDGLDLATGELRINKQISVVDSKPVVSEPKTKAAVRTLILPPAVLKVMREYRTSVDSQWLFPSPKKADLPTLPSSVHQRLHRILDHAGCERVRFHDLRHTFATNALAYGMDVKTLSTILGHVSSVTMLSTYSHVTDEMRQRAAIKIDQGIVKAEPKACEESKPYKGTMTTFQARKRWSRKAS